MTLLKGSNHPSTWPYFMAWVNLEKPQYGMNRCKYGVNGKDEEHAKQLLMEQLKEFNPTIESIYKHQFA